MEVKPGVSLWTVCVTLPWRRHWCCDTVGHPKVKRLKCSFKCAYCCYREQEKCCSTWIICRQGTWPNKWQVWVPKWLTQPAEPTDSEVMCLQCWVTLRAWSTLRLWGPRSDCNGVLAFVRLVNSLGMDDFPELQFEIIMYRKHHTVSQWKHRTLHVLGHL